MIIFLQGFPQLCTQVTNLSRLQSIRLEKRRNEFIITSQTCKKSPFTESQRAGKIQRISISIGICLLPFNYTCGKNCKTPCPVKTCKNLQNLLLIEAIFSFQITGLLQRYISGVFTFFPSAVDSPEGDIYGSPS